MNAGHEPEHDASYVRMSEVSKAYQGHGFAVRDLDLGLSRGEFLTLLGPSGSGKTTTLQMVAGFIHPTQGSVVIDGRPVTDLPAHRRDIGVVFQNYALFPHMSVEQNVAFPLSMRGLTRDERLRRVGEALELVQLSGAAKRLPKQLSGGQQQRVALARAIVFKPALLLMDEPLGALDRHLRESMAREITSLVRELGATTIYVTHDQDEALTMSDRIAVFNNGYLEQVGTVREVYEEPTTRFVASFLGESTLLHGTVDRSSNLVRGAGWVARIPGDSTLADADTADVAIRPHVASLSGDRGDSVATGCNRATGVLRGSQFLGSETRHEVDLDDGGRFIVRERPTLHDPRVGDRVSVTWPVEATQVLEPRAGSAPRQSVT